MRIYSTISRVWLPVNRLKLALVFLAIAIFCGREGFLWAEFGARLAAVALTLSAVMVLALPLLETLKARGIRYIKR